MGILFRRVTISIVFFYAITIIPIIPIITIAITSRINIRIHLMLWTEHIKRRILETMSPPIILFDVFLYASYCRRNKYPNFIEKHLLNKPK